MKTNFKCLDPRKKKKKILSCVLKPLGNVEFSRFPPIRFRGYPESKARALKAFKQAIRPLNNPLLAWAQCKLYEWQYNGSRHFFSTKNNAAAVVWNGLNGSRHVYMMGAMDAGAKTLFFEEAPLPNRFTVDVSGVNFTNSLPRSISPYLNWLSKSNIEPDTWRQAGRKIVQRPALKPAKISKKSAPPLSEPFLFVPLQVPNDSQLRIYGGAFRTVESFVEAIIEAGKNLPNGWHVRIKEHPTSEQSISHLFDNDVSAPVFLDNFTDTFEQVAASEGVLTINSSVGLEAMFYDKPVVAVGQCFWAIEGVAISATTTIELTRVMSMPDQLKFDIQARNAFMNFLTEVYYPELKYESNGALACENQEIEKIRRRLFGPDELGFWKTK